MFGKDKNDSYSGRKILKSISCETNTERNYSDPLLSISNNSNTLTKKIVLSDVGFIQSSIDDTNSCSKSRSLSEYESNKSLNKSKVKNRVDDKQNYYNFGSDGNDKSYHNIGQETPFPLLKDDVNAIIQPLNNIEISNHTYPSNVVQTVKENHEIDNHSFLIAKKDNNKFCNQVKRSTITINRLKFNNKSDGSLNKKYDGNNGKQRLYIAKEPNQMNISKVDTQNDNYNINLNEPTNEDLEKRELKELIKSEIDTVLERMFSKCDESQRKIKDSSDTVLKRKRGLECRVKECSDEGGYEIKKKRTDESSSRCINPDQYSLSSDTVIHNIDRVSNSYDINLSSDKASSNIVESDWIDISETSNSSISNSSTLKRYQDSRIVKSNTGSNIVSKKSDGNIDILFFDSREDSVECFEYSPSLEIASLQESGEVIEKTNHSLRSSKRKKSLLTDLKEEFMDSFADDFEVELNSLIPMKNNSVGLEIFNNNSENHSEINNIEIEKDTMSNSSFTVSNRLVQNSSQKSDHVNIFVSDNIFNEQKNLSECDNESLISCLEESFSETTMHDSNQNSRISSTTETSDIIKINKEILQNIDNIRVIVNTRTNSAENNLQESSIKDKITVPNIQSYKDTEFYTDKVETSLEAMSADSLIIEEIYESIKITDNNIVLPNQNAVQNNENFISTEISDYNNKISKLLSYENNNINEALELGNNSVNISLNYENDIMQDVFNSGNNTQEDIYNYQSNTLNNQELNYVKNNLNKASSYANNTSNEVLNNISNSLNEVLVRGNNMLGYENYILNEDLVQENNTLNELLNYESNNTLNEILHNNSNNILDYENNALNKLIDYGRRSNQAKGINSNQADNSKYAKTCDASTSSDLDSKISNENLKTTEYDINEKHVSVNDFHLTYKDKSSKIIDNNKIDNDTKKDFNNKTGEFSKIKTSEIQAKDKLNQNKIKNEIQRDNIQIKEGYLPLNNMVSKAERSKDISDNPKIENIKIYNKLDTKLHDFNYKTLFNINNKIEKVNKEMKNSKLSNNLNSSVNNQLRKSSVNSLTENSSNSLYDEIRVPWHEIFPNHKCHLHYPKRGIWWTCVHLLNYSRKPTKSNIIKK